MDRVSEKERSDRDRDREHKHRHHRHKERHRDEKRHEDDFEDERFTSSRRSKDEKHRNGDRHRSPERPSTSKRKDHGEADAALDRSEKRLRVSDGSKEERRERRRFEDRVDGESRDLNGVHREEGTEDRKSKELKNRKKEEPLVDGQARREKRKFGDRVKEEKASEVEEAGTVNEEDRKGDRRYGDGSKEEKVGYAEEGAVRKLRMKPEVDRLDGDQSNAAYEKSGAADNLAALEPLTEEARAISNNSATSGNSLPTKVSSINAPIENEGVNVTRSDEIPGKFSTDGVPTSVAGKGGSGNLSLDALAKAKRALQMQKELSEKLKKIPMLNKGATSSIAGSESSPSSLRTAVSASYVQTTSGLQSLPAVAPTALKPPAAGSTAPQSAGLATIPNIEAVKRAQELAAKMGFHQDPEFAPLINMFPAPVPADVSVPQRPSKAPVLRLDAQGREVDEHGNVINQPKLTNLSTLKVNINKQKKEAFQILRPDLDAGLEANPHFDPQMGINKTKLLRPKKSTFQFVEEGKWSRQAEIIRFKSQFGEAQAKELKTKQAQLAKAKAEPDINPNLIEISDRVLKKEKPKDPIPEVEWWDLPILPSGIYVDASKDKLNMDRITIYIEHPRPIEPPAEPAPPDPQPLKLTKGEQKKLRTQRRLAKERDRQEMIRQGLIEPPKPKVKMSNLMKVLGSEATQDPTKLEMEIRSAAAEREQAHVDRNIARKLTPAERREKKERKLFDDSNTLETIVSVYKVNRLTHPKARFQVDVNAQENRMTGCAVISEGISVIVVEGGKKSNKRYKNLMLKRIDWAAAAVGNEEEGADDQEDAPANKCLLVWQGSVAKRSFNRFLIHQCRTEAAARKVFADAGVAHYWELAVNFSDELA